MSNTVGRLVPFSLGGLQALVTLYLGGLLMSWDQLGVFDALLCAAADLEMVVLHWKLGSLLSEIILVVAPGTVDACILRINFAPEYLWLGIHSVGTAGSGMQLPAL